MVVISVKNVFIPVRIVLGQPQTVILVLIILVIENRHLIVTVWPVLLKMEVNSASRVLIHVLSV